MNTIKVSEESKTNAKQYIDRVLSTTIDNPNNPDSLNFFQSDTYRFYFLMSFMSEFFNENEISQEYAISLVPKKFASRIKRLQVLKTCNCKEYNELKEIIEGTKKSKY